MRKLLLYLSLTLVSFSLPSAELTYQCRFEQGWIAPGGVVPFTLEFLHPGETVFVSAITNGTHPDLEFGINSSVRRTAASGQIITTVQGELQIFTISNLRFPGIRVVLSNRKGTVSRVLGKTVFTVVPPPVNTKKRPLILPLKGPLGYPASYTLAVVILLALFLLTAALLYYLKRKRQNASVVLPGMDDVVDPWDLVTRRLELLRNSEPVEEQEIKDFYFQLTETVRMYLTGRSRLPFEESTTTELKLLLEQVFWINTGAADTIALLFQDADLVKFARFTPERASIRNFLDSIGLWLEDMDAEYRRYCSIMKGESRKERPGV